MGPRRVHTLRIIVAPASSQRAVRAPHPVCCARDVCIDWRGLTARRRAAARRRPHRTRHCAARARTGGRAAGPPSRAPHAPTRGRAMRPSRRSTRACGQRRGTQRSAPATPTGSQSRACAASPRPACGDGRARVRQATTGPRARTRTRVPAAARGGQAQAAAAVIPFSPAFGMRRQRRRSGMAVRPTRMPPMLARRPRQAQPSAGNGRGVMRRVRRVDGEVYAEDPEPAVPLGICGREGRNLTLDAAGALDNKREHRRGCTRNDAPQQQRAPQHRLRVEQADRVVAKQPPLRLEDKVPFLPLVRPARPSLDHPAFDERVLSACQRGSIVWQRIAACDRVACCRHEPIHAVDALDQPCRLLQGGLRRIGVVVFSLGADERRLVVGDAPLRA
eukprot:4596801-Prymnesium_polylepis.1